MAVIGSIRKRGTLIMVVVGISMLAFILGDSLITRFFAPSLDNSLGRVNDTKLSPQEYDQLLTYYENSWQAQNLGAVASEQDRQSFQDKAWYDMLEKYLLGPEFKKLGLILTSEEYSDMQVGITVDAQFKQLFTNPQTGEFNPQQVAQVIEQLNADIESIPEENRERFFGQREYLKAMLRDMKKRRVFDKYTSMVSKGMYVTTKEGEKAFKEQVDKATIRFVAKAYNAVPDSTIEISDKEISQYYKEFGYKFRGRRSRNVSVLMFNFNPTEADTLEILKKTEELALTFSNGTAVNDSQFVQLNSENVVLPQYYRKGSLQPAFDSTLFDAAAGTVIGPVKENQYFTVAKKVTDTLISDSARVSHILVKVDETRSDEDAKKMADSLLAVIKGGEKFYDIAKKHSEDPGSAVDSGKIGWVAEGMNYVPEFIDSSLAGEKGQILIARTQFGYHLIEVQERTPKVKKILVAMFSKEIVPSETTKQLAYAKAAEFANVNWKEKNFDAEKYFSDYATANKFNLLPDITLEDNAKNLAYLQEPKEVIRWALEAKRGEVSQPFENGYNYTVSVVTVIRDYGIPQLENIKPLVKKEAIKHKKALQFIEEFKNVLSGNQNIDAVASASKLEVITAPDVTLQSCVLSGAGQEFEVAGAAFATAPGKLSGPVEGSRGVYVYVVDAVTPGITLQDPAAYRKQLTAAAAGKANNNMVTALFTKAKLIDGRGKYY